jgi:two-component system chemotaxis response regulator CheY
MKTILVVDDEFSIAETVAEVIAFAGYQTVCAANGRAGLDAARSARPALILLDYMMPVMDGLQMLARVRADPDLREIPVVMMTAAPLGIADASRRWDALLIKPFDATQLVRTIRKLIGDP